MGALVVIGRWSERYLRHPAFRPEVRSAEGRSHCDSIAALRPEVRSAEGRSDNMNVLR
jgi:hypothetical protein